METAKPEKLALGIDFGTSRTRTGVWVNNEIIIVPHEDDNKAPYSDISFTDASIYCGDLARTQFSKNALNTVSGIKRILGRKFQDPLIQEDLKLLSLKMVAGLQGRPEIIVLHQGEEIRFIPEQIAAIILSKLKKKAENFIKKPIEDAIISVPASFTHAQRQALKDAGAIAGLKVLRLVKEPIARLITLETKRKKHNDLDNIVIVDIGSGTCDICLVTIDGDVFEIRTMSGNSHLAGDDFDTKIVELCIADFKAKTGIDVQNDPRAVRRLRSVCERTKRILSSSTKATIEIDCLSGDLDFYYELTRSKFEEICEPYFEEIKLHLEKVVKEGEDIGVKKNEFNRVILTGGTTGIPRIQSLISEFFPEIRIERPENDLESVAYGTAFYCAILNQSISVKGDLPLIIDAIPTTLGIETSTGEMAPIVKKNYAIPCKKNNIFSTAADNQSQVTIKVFEGENKLTKDNCLLDKFVLEGIPPAPKGVPEIEVIFSIDSNGILSVSAKDKKSGAVCEVLVENSEFKLSDNEIERMKNENEEFMKYLYPPVIEDNNYED